jgi:hypothetical protein
MHKGGKSRLIASVKNFFKILLTTAFGCAIITVLCKVAQLFFSKAEKGNDDRYRPRFKNTDL